MSLDFQQVRRQVVELGEKAPERQRAQQILRRRATDLLTDYADRSLELREKVELVARQYDPNLRCAMPADQGLRHAERLDGSFPLPALPGEATVLAADGSQIAPDRHAEVLYGLVNVGAIQMRLGTADPPLATIDSRLIYDEQLDNRSGGTLSEAALALQRDLFERKMLARLAQQALAPVITFTDGPMELWGAKDAGEAADFQQSLDEYLSVLKELYQLQVITAGYVDKPFATLVVRLLEIAMTPQDQLSHIRDQRPLAGITDLNLLRELINPGERSAVFAIQSKSAASYRGSLALHFFYLNLGRAGNPHIARVEVPAWVAGDPQKLDQLHAVLVGQCRLMGSRPYPYLLHRAHETAVVSLDDKAQVTQMIALELRRRGVEVGEISYKQAAKDLAARTRYER